MLYKVAVTGSKWFSDYTKFKSAMNKYIDPTLEAVCILTGYMSGTEELAVRYTKEEGCSLERFGTDTRAYDGKAVNFRNNAMIAACDMIIVFYDNKSSVSSNAIKMAYFKGRKIHIEGVDTDANPRES